MKITVDAYFTFIIATIVLLCGRVLVRKVNFLREFNIPEPVAGGLLAAIIIFLLHMVKGFEFQFDTSLQNAFMLVFFSSIGLSADFSKLRAGGAPLVKFLVIVGVFVFVQDIVGVSLAAALGLKPLVGLLAGSIPLTGGHGTSGAWGTTFQTKYGIDSALSIAIACATFGLVAGGLLGGPVARRLIKGVKTPGIPEDKLEKNVTDNDTLQFEEPEKQRLMTTTSTIDALALFAVCLISAKVMHPLLSEYKFNPPEFVWALGTGVVIRNVMTLVFKIKMFDRPIDVFGNASLSLFLAMALLSLKIWQLSGLALPIIVILAAQTIVMALYATFVTFKLMGSDYDAAVLSAGHCGFGLGATPTAIANMQAITDKYGPSHKAFLIVPMVGAFFIDFINLFVIQGFIAVLH